MSTVSRDGNSSTIEMAPENCSCYAVESNCTGVDTCPNGNRVTTKGAYCSLGVFAPVIDSWVLVVSASVGSVVEGIMAT